MGRRIMRINQFLFLVFFFVTIFAVTVPNLYADGCFVWQKGVDLNEPTQKAIIYWKDGREILILQVKYEGPAEDFAWIVPLPTKPEVAAIDADKSPFSEISLYTQVRQRWGYRGIKTAYDKQEVTVLEQKVVGVYDVAVLAATDAGALAKWLNHNGYTFPMKRKDVLKHYTEKRWFYVAMRIDRKSLGRDEVKKLKVGELQPIRFSFAATEMTYPLKISSVNAGETELLLYLLANAPMVVKGEHEREGFSIEKNIPVVDGPFVDPQYGTFRKVLSKELPFTWEALMLPSDAKLSLCKYRAVYKTEEMTEDLEFSPFDPLSYWKKRFRNLGKDSYRNKLIKQRAVAILTFRNADLFHKYANDKDYEVRSAVAEIKSAPADILAKLARDKNEAVRRAVAQNPTTPSDIKSELAMDDNAGVRRGVARSVNVSVEVLNRLADDSDYVVQREVALNVRSTAGILQKLAANEWSSVKEAVANNPKTPADVLEELAKDEFHTVRANVASHQNTPVNSLRSLAKDTSDYVRFYVARNPHTPIDVLRTLAEDVDSTVRYGVVWNPSVSTDVLQVLANDENKLNSGAARQLIDRRRAKTIKKDQ